MTSSARQLVFWPFLFASFLGFLAMELTSACLDDLPPLVDPAPLVDDDASSSPCGDSVVATNQDGTDAGESCDPADASIFGCVDCQLSCPEGVLDDAGRHCFFSAGTATTFQAARTACEIRKGHIVTIASAREADLAEVSGTIDPKLGYWVGLSYAAAVSGYVPPLLDEPGVPSDGTSCPGCFSFGDGGDFAIHPTLDASTSIRECLVAQNEGGTRRWLQVPCATNTTPFSVLCEREPPGRRIIDCAGNYQCTTIFVTEGRKRYLVSLAETLTADGAKARCAEFPNGRLAVFESREEREDLVRELLKRQITEPTTLWIGLAHDGTAWLWDDGRPESGHPIVWGREQPRGIGDGRAFLRIDRTQFDTQLAYSSETDGGKTDERRAFICERAP